MSNDLHREMLEEKLAKLAAFEAIEAKKEHWAPWNELEAKLQEMHTAKDKIDNAASYAEEAEEYCNDVGIMPSHHACDELWQCSWDLEKLIENTETESEDLYIELGGE